MRELEDYLKEVTSGILNQREAEETRMELEDHILSKVEILCISGMKEREALRKVLEEMGAWEDQQEEFAKVHAISFQKSRIVYEDGVGQCRRMAKILSKNIGIPLNPLSEFPEIMNEEVLILIRKGNYQGKCSPQVVQYIKEMNKKEIKTVISISLIFSFRRFNCYYNVRTNPVFYSNVETYYRMDTPLAVMLHRKGIETVIEKQCFRDPWFFGWVRGMEVIHMISYLERELVQKRYLSES